MHKRLVLGLSVLPVVAAALAAGCGGGGSSSSTPTTRATTTGGTGAAAAQAAADKALFTYAACMRGKGVNIPDPVRGANGRYSFPQIPAKVTSAPGVRAKAQACAAKLPGRTFRGGGGYAQSPAQRAAFQKFSDCMSNNGASLGRPDGQQARPPGAQGYPRGPVPGSGAQRPGGDGGGGFFNSTDPKVQKALAKCRKLLPEGFGNRPAP
jgi:hypothetical protein